MTADCAVRVGLGSSGTPWRHSLHAQIRAAVSQRTTGSEAEEDRESVATPWFEGYSAGPAGAFRPQAGRVQGEIVARSEKARR